MLKLSCDRSSVVGVQLDQTEWNHRKVGLETVKVSARTFVCINIRHLHIRRHYCNLFDHYGGFSLNNVLGDWDSKVKGGNDIWLDFHSDHLCPAEPCIPVSRCVNLAKSLHRYRAGIF